MPATPKDPKRPPAARAGRAAPLTAGQKEGRLACVKLLLLSAPSGVGVEVQLCLLGCLGIGSLARRLPDMRFLYLVRLTIGVKAPSRAKPSRPTNRSLLPMFPHASELLFLGSIALNKS